MIEQIRMTIYNVLVAFDGRMVGFILYLAVFMMAIYPVVKIGVGSFRFILGKARWERMLDSQSIVVVIFMILGFLLVSLPLFYVYWNIGMCILGD